MKPKYNLKNSTWEYTSPSGNKFHEESLVEAVSGWLGDGLYYPFFDDRNNEPNFDYHGHSFSEVLCFLLHDDGAKHMSLEGFEEYYGKTEIELFYKMKEKLLKEEFNEE